MTANTDNADFLRQQRAERERVRLETMLRDQETRARAFCERMEAARRGEKLSAAGLVYDI